MPTDAKVGNAHGAKPNGKPGKKGAPLGIPMWGWIVGIALGLLVGYMVIKNKGTSSSDVSNSGSGSTPLGNTDSGGGGGTVAGSPSPNDAVLTGAGSTQGPGSDPGSVSPTGDSSTSTNPISPSDSPLISYGGPTIPSPVVNLGSGGGYTTSAPGSDYVVPIPPSGGQAQKFGGVTGNPSNVHIPGLQQ